MNHQALVLTHEKWSCSPSQHPKMLAVQQEPIRSHHTDMRSFVPRLAELNLTLNDLREVRVGEEAERGTWLVIEVSGAFLKPLPSVLDEADVQRGCHDAEP